MTRPLQDRLLVGAPPEVVWSLLVDVKSWRLWWPAVRHARTSDFKPLREKSRFEGALEVGRLKSGMTGRVTLCAEGRALTLEGRWLASAFRQEWFLSAREEGSAVTARATLGGPAGWMLLLPAGRRRSQDGLRRQLTGLKRVAERMV